MYFSRGMGDGNQFSVQVSKRCSSIERQEGFVTADARWCWGPIPCRETSQHRTTTSPQQCNSSWELLQLLPLFLDGCKANFCVDCCFDLLCWNSHSDSPVVLSSTSLSRFFGFFFKFGPNIKSSGVPSCEESCVDSVFLMRSIGPRGAEKEETATKNSSGLFKSSGRSYHNHQIVCTLLVLWMQSMSFLLTRQ